MFRETVTATDGTSTTGNAAEVHALSLLQTAVRRAYRIEATYTGGVIITRSVWDGHSTMPACRIVTLDPAQPAGRISTTARERLQLIDEYAPRGRTRLENNGRITAGIYSLPPAACRRLLDTGLVVIEDSRPRISLTARLALVAQAHRTRTTPPLGYVKPADIGMTCIGRNTPAGGLLYSRRSYAACSCYGLSKHAGDRDVARRYARGHREEVTTRALATVLAA